MLCLVLDLKVGDIEKIFDIGTSRSRDGPESREQ